MAARAQQRSGRDDGFRIEGRVRLAESEQVPEELSLKAYAFDRGGQFLGMSDVDRQGAFRIRLDIQKPGPVELVVGPETDPELIRKSAVHSRTFSVEDWAGKRQLTAELELPREIWWPWRPVRICVSGRVRKVGWPFRRGFPCSVPYVKVEIFDVDREGCWWPFLKRRWPELVERPVIHIPELLREFPIPKPKPGPGPVDFSRLVGIGGEASLVGASPGPVEMSATVDPEDLVALDPQAIPPGRERLETPAEAGPELGSSGVSSFQKEDERARGAPVGEVRTLSRSAAAQVERLTLTSRVAPWDIVPRCFYSKRLVCETTTDCEGFFKCCFRWWPIHWRGGRLRFDARPDVIVRVTQVIDGVETVVYMDPYTSTRWDVTNTYLDLFLDDPDVRCGNPKCPPPQPAGPVVFYTLVGMDEVYKIDQSNGLYPNASAPGIDPSISNLAYGSTLRVYANFGAGLSTAAPQRYYRLSYAKKTGPPTPPDSAFNPITSPPALWDTRVDKTTLISSTHKLGPYTVGPLPGLYEVRNSADYYWYDPNLIGEWYSWIQEPSVGTYVLRLEVFDAAGNKLTTASGLVDYRDGTVPPPGPLPSMTDHCDLVVLLDNKTLDLPILTTPAVNDCGVIPWVPNLTLTFGLHVQQGHGRLHAWGFYYTKGVDPTAHTLSGGSPSNNQSGAPDPVNQTVVVPASDPMISGLATTCAYALKLWGYAHITDGSHNYLDQHNYLFYREALQAIAIEKCS